MCGANRNDGFDRRNRNLLPTVVAVKNSHNLVLEFGGFRPFNLR